MKCPYCGAAHSGVNICSGCGKKIEIPGQEVEIEYKEFKVSEFLEIRRKQEGSRSCVSGEVAGKDIKSTFGKSCGIPRSEFRNNKKTGIGKEKDRSPGKAGNNLFLIVLMIVIAAVMAGAFYLPHLFLRH
jgi:hypothetical protein